MKLVLALFSFVLACEAKKILMQGLPFATSHHMVLAKIGRELASRGHEVHFVRSSVDSSNVNTTGLHVHWLQLPTSKEHYANHVLELANEEPLKGAKMILEEKAEICKTIADQKDLLELFKTMDVALVDPAYLCSVIYSYVMKIPIRVDISPVNFYDPFMSAPYQIPQPWATSPQMGTKLTPDMSFVERVFNSLVWLIQYDVRHSFLENLVVSVHDKLDYEGKLYDSFQDVSIVLFPTNFAFDFPRVLPPNAKTIGPILPEPGVFPFKGNDDLSQFVSEAKKGVILVSFGTLARLPLDQAQILADAVASCEGYHVIWKFNGEAPKLGANTRKYKWIPQNDILGHSKTVLFVSHGGANGVLEAAFHGVPILGYPMFADQWDNIARAVWRKMAISVNKDTATVESLKQVIHQLLNEPEYRQNAKRISAIMQDTPRTPTQQAADWIDWAIKYDGATFQKLPSFGRPWYVNQGVDVMAFWTGFVFGLIMLLKFCVKKCCCSTSKAKKE